MSTYYCIHGATNNGDGTTSAEAATPGGVGAFNDAIACLNGSEAGLSGAPTPYKIVYKTNHGAANITASTTSALTLNTGVDSDNAITHVFDDGTDWPGEGGVFTLQMDASAAIIDWVTDTRWAQIICRAKNNLIIAKNLQGGHDYIFGGNSLISGVYFREDYAGTDHYAQYQIYEQGSGNTAGFLNNIKIDLVEGQFTDFKNKFRCLNASFGSYRVDGLTCNVKSLVSAANGPVLLVDNASMLKNVSISGDTPALGIAIEQLLRSEKKDIASNIYYDPAAALSNSQNLDLLRRKGSAGLFDFVTDDDQLSLEWKQGANYPTLNALLPDGVTGWSIKVDTTNLPSSSTRPFQIFQKAIYYGQASGSKTVKVHILIPNSFAAPARNEWFVTLGYQNTSDDMVVETSCSDLAIPASGAGWSTLTYGAITYVAYSLDVPVTNLKQNSVIFLSAYTTRKPNVAGEFYFIDPEPEIV